MSDSESGNGLSLFDETASAAGNFPTALRGYDRAAVDEYVRALESRVQSSNHEHAAMEQQVSELRAQTTQLQRELDTRPTGEIDYSSLGGRASNILRLAEEESRELMEKATADAKAVRDAANREADEVRSNAQTEHAEIKSSGTEEIAKLREQGLADVRAQVERARAESGSLVDAARREAEALRREAAQQAETTRQTAYLEGESQKRSAETEATETRRSIAAERENALAELRRIHSESVAATGALLAEATQHHQEAGARLSEDIERATKLRADSETEAEQVKLAAINEADTTLTEAKKQAARLRQRTQAEFDWRKEQLRRETENLEQRKQAVLAQLSGLSAFASQGATGSAAVPSAQVPDLPPFEETEFPGLPDDVDDLPGTEATETGAAEPTEDTVDVTSEVAAEDVQVTGQPEESDDVDADVEETTMIEVPSSQPSAGRSLK